MGKRRKELPHTALHLNLNFSEGTMFWSLDFHQVKQRNKEHLRQIKPTCTRGEAIQGPVLSSCQAISPTGHIFLFFSRFL